MKCAFQSKMPKFNSGHQCPQSILKTPPIIFTTLSITLPKSTFVPHHLNTKANLLKSKALPVSHDSRTRGITPLEKNAKSSRDQLYFMWTALRSIRNEKMLQTVDTQWLSSSEDFAIGLLTHILKISVAPHCWSALLLLLDHGGQLLYSILVLGDRGSRHWKWGVHCFGRRSANTISWYNLLLEHFGLLLLRRNRSWGVQNVHASAWWCQLRLLAWTWHSVFSFYTT